jgi:hypothetical protein
MAGRWLGAHQHSVSIKKYTKCKGIRKNVLLSSSKDHKVARELNKNSVESYTINNIYPERFDNSTAPAEREPQKNKRKNTRNRKKLNIPVLLFLFSPVF